MAVTFAGIDLIDPSEEIREKIDGKIPLRDICEAVRPAWPGFFQSHLGYQGWQPEDPIELNTLRWPVGASRWAMFHGLVDTARLAAIRAVCQASSPATFTMSGVSAISTSLYMLPARPLFPGFFLLSLVDERFWWWDKTGSVQVLPSDSWETLFDKIEAAYGITVSVDTIPATEGGAWVASGWMDPELAGGTSSPNYFRPSQDLQSLRQPLPILLDAAAMSIGQRIVRKLDGSVVTQTPSTARAIAETAGSWIKHAGGQFQFGSNQDQFAHVPERVQVVFPKLWHGVVQRASVHAENVTLASLALDEFAGVTATSGTKVIRSSMLAVYAANDTLANEWETQRLAGQLAEDWYQWSLPTWDLTVVGIYPWLVEGNHDVTWRHRKEACFTRVTPVPTDVGETLTSHTSDNGTCLFGWGGDGVHHSLTTHGNWITVPGNLSITSNQTALVLGANATQRWSANAPWTIKGINASYSADGIRYRAWNVGANNITIAHQDLSASATDRIFTATGGNLTLGPLQMIEFEYLTYDGCWRASMGSGNTTVNSTVTTYDLFGEANQTVIANGTNAVVAPNVRVLLDANVTIPGRLTSSNLTLTGQANASYLYTAPNGSVESGVFNAGSFTFLSNVSCGNGSFTFLQRTATWANGSISISGPSPLVLNCADCCNGTPPISYCENCTGCGEITTYTATIGEITGTWECDCNFYFEEEVTLTKEGDTELFPCDWTGTVGTPPADFALQLHYDVIEEQWSLFLSMPAIVDECCGATLTYLLGEGVPFNCCGPNTFVFDSSVEDCQGVDPSPNDCVGTTITIAPADPCAAVVSPCCCTRELPLTLYGYFSFSGDDGDCPETFVEPFYTFTYDPDSNSWISANEGPPNVELAIECNPETGKMHLTVTVDFDECSSTDATSDAESSCLAGVWPFLVSGCCDHELSFTLQLEEP